MKKLCLIIFVLFFLLSCNTLEQNYQITDQELETSSGNKSGIVVMDNGDAILFKSAYVLIDKKKIYIINSDLKQEINWRKVRTIHVYNINLQDDYIKQLKQLEKIQKPEGATTK